MADLKDIRLSSDVVEEGDWFPFYEDIEFKIASAKNERFQKRIAKVGATARKGFRIGSAAASEAANEEARRIMIQELFKGWRSKKGDGVITVDGEDLTFSTEAAVDLLMAPEFVAAYDFFESVAVDAAEFADETRARRAGNSNGVSSGTSSTGRKKSSPSS